MKQSGAKSFYLDKLRELMFDIMNRENYTLEKMAEICDISYKQLCNILYGLSEDMFMSTFERICENNMIPYECIFEYNADIRKKNLDFILSDFVFTNGSAKYRLQRD